VLPSLSLFSMLTLMPLLTLMLMSLKCKCPLLEKYFELKSISFRSPPKFGPLLNCSLLNCSLLNCSLWKLFAIQLLAIEFVGFQFVGFQFIHRQLVRRRWLAKLELDEVSIGISQQRRSVEGT
jgi:hypothetical protein